MQAAAVRGNPSNGKTQLLPPRRLGALCCQKRELASLSHGNRFQDPQTPPGYGGGTGGVWDARELVLQPTCKRLCRESFPTLGLWSPGLKQLAVPGTPVWRLCPNFHHRANRRVCKVPILPRPERTFIRQHALAVRACLCGPRFAPASRMLTWFSPYAQLATELGSRCSAHLGGG